MRERTIDIPTKDGATTTFIVHPERGGPHPPILFFMDAPAIREELRDMARRPASGGYYVMPPQHDPRRGGDEAGLAGRAGRARADVRANEPAEHPAGDVRRGGVDRLPRR